jgi:hypothetical protein
MVSSLYRHADNCLAVDRKPAVAGAVRAWLWIQVRREALGIFFFLYYLEAGWMSGRFSCRRRRQEQHKQQHQACVGDSSETKHTRSCGGGQIKSTKQQTERKERKLN